jgi:hypothetical protein
MFLQLFAAGTGQSGFIILQGLEQHGRSSFESMNRT